jgi:hypothetical protein
MTNYIYFALLFVCVAWLCGYILIKVPHNYFFKLIIIPVLFGVSLFSANRIVDLMGFPIEGVPSGKFTYIHHVIGTAKEQKIIQLWVKREDVGDTRLYQFPFDQSIADQLQKAANRQKRGGATFGEFSSSTKGTHLIFTERLPTIPQKETR